jgi:hypothetical protein
LWRFFFAGYIFFFGAEAGEETRINNAQIYVAAGESAGKGFLKCINNGEIHVADLRKSARILSRRTMENIYCSSCESARIFEPKNNGKDLLQQLQIGKDFRAEEIKEKAILADSHRQGF